MDRLIDWLTWLILPHFFSRCDQSRSPRPIQVIIAFLHAAPMERPDHPTERFLVHLPGHLHQQGIHAGHEGQQSGPFSTRNGHCWSCAYSFCPKNEPQHRFSLWLFHVHFTGRISAGGHFPSVPDDTAAGVWRVFFGGRLGGGALFSSNRKSKVLLLYRESYQKTRKSCPFHCRCGRIFGRLSASIGITPSRTLPLSRASLFWPCTDSVECTIRELWTCCSGRCRLSVSWVKISLWINKICRRRALQSINQSINQSIKWWIARLII